MKSHLKTYLILLFFLISPILLIYPQTDQYKFRHLTTDDGLPTNYSFQVLKDSRGFIWISTRAGLCRYDGYNMKVFQYDPLDSTSLSYNRIGDDCMVEDTNGYLWIGTANGLNRYDPVTETFKRYSHNPDDPGSISNDNIYCVYKDAAGTLWAGTANKGGLNKYDPGTDKFRVYKHNPDDSIFQIPTIRTLLEDRKGILWLGTSKGVFQFEKDRESFVRVRMAEIPDLIRANVIKDIFEDTDGTILFGTPYGFLIYDTIKKVVSPFKPLYDEQKNIIFIDAHEDPFEPDHTLWINNFTFLYKYDRLTGTLIEVNHYPNDHDGVLSATISFFWDESGILWIPGTSGVNILNPGQSRSYILPDFAEKCQYPFSFLEDHNGHLWVGTEHLYLIHYDQEMNLIKAYHSFPVTDDGEVFKGGFRSLYQDSERNLWLGTMYNGVFLLEQDLEEPIQCQLPVSGQIGVNDIFEDSQGVLWVGTGQGLFQRKKGELPLTRFRLDTAWGELNNTVVLCINEDHEQNLWIGTAVGGFGLFRQLPENRGTSSFLRYKHDPGNNRSLSNDWVWSVYEDVFNNLWIATENGLNRYIRDEDRFEQHFNTSDRGTNFIYDITGDDNGYLWMITESGLVRYNPKTDIKNSKTTKNFKQILIHKDVVCYGIYKNKSGELFLRSIDNDGKGYFRFHPDSLYENRQPPPVVITSFLVRNKEMKTDSSILFKKQIRLNYDQNFFSFEFAALDYYNPQKNQYAYMLEGLDNGWIYSGNQRIARYTKVPPGSYVFRVKGSNNDGYWNEAGASIAITILPPPWKTWWAYTIYGIFFIGLIVAWRRYDLKRQRLKQDLEIEHVEAEKLKELDTMKSRFFANISHEFRTPLTLILGPLQKVFSKISDEETKQDLNIMQRNARRLQTLINQLLSLSKLESGKMKLQAKEENIVALVNGYIQSFESLAKQKKIDLTFNSTEENIQLFVDKDKIEKILYNLLSNAFKFTGAGGKIEVKITPLNPPSRGDKSEPQLSPLEGGRGVNISISDTGRGIPHEKLEHIFDRFYQADDSYTKDQEGTGIGLALTKELVDIHHGEISVESKPGMGTTFTVFLPLGKKHLKPEEIGELVVREEDSFGESVKMVEFVEDPDQFVEPNTKETIIDDDEKEDSNPLLLIVEDNDDLRSYIRSYLTNGYQISEAIDGEMGLKKAIEKIPDLVVSDVMMPKMDGFELCKKLKTDERTSHIPVILLTARAGKDSRIEGLEIGADDFITKPFDVDELLIRIKNLIEQRNKLQDQFLKNAEIIGLSQLMGLPASGISSMDQKFLKRAVDTVEEHLDDFEFSVDHFTKEMAVSQMQMYRKLKALVNLSANEFIRSIRLSHAAQLIKQKSDNIAQISYAVGFNNPSYFAECFKKQFGVSPSEYS